MRKSIGLDGKKISKLLIEQDMFTNDLVEKSGLSRTTVSAIKSGKRCNQLSASKIASALGVDVTEIMKEA